jgi:hypothetical protein
MIRRDTLHLGDRLAQRGGAPGAAGARGMGGVPISPFLRITSSERLAGAAISAGIAVAALGRRVAPPGTIDIGPHLGLPPLPVREVVLYANLADSRSRQSLRTLAAAIRATKVANASSGAGARRPRPRLAAARP